MNKSFMQYHKKLNEKVRKEDSVFDQVFKEVETQEGELMWNILPNGDTFIRNKDGKMILCTCGGIMLLSTGIK